MSQKIFEGKKDLLRIGAVTLAALLMASNINVFVNAGGLYPGGATGLTLLILRVCEKLLGFAPPFTVVNVALNAIPVYIGFRFIGHKFTIYSCLMIVLTGLFTDLLPTYPLTDDILLVSIFGGIFNGFAICICLSVDATSGGTDFIAIYMSEKKNKDSWNLSLAINIVILLSAGLIFGWDKALYSIIFQYVSTQVLHSLHKRYQKETLLIVTSHPEDVCRIIDQHSNHDATIVQSEGATGHRKNFLVYSVVSREEYMKILHFVREVDPEAFANCINTDLLSGNFYQKPYDN